MCSDDADRCVDEPMNEHPHPQGDDDLEEEGLDWDELEKRAKRDDTNKRDWEGDQPASSKPAAKRRRR